MQKTIKFFGALTLVLLVLVIIASTSDYWEKMIHFSEGSFVWSFVYFFSTIGAGLLVISLIMLAILIMIDSRKK